MGRPGSYILKLDNATERVVTAAETVIEDVFPDSLSIGTLPAGCTRTGQAVTCKVPAGTSTASFLIPVTPLAAAFPSVTNTATASGGGDPACTASGACKSTVTTQVGLPLAITSTKTASANPLVAAVSGQYYTIDITVANEPTTAPLLIADTLPTGLTLASAPSLIAGSTTGMLTACPSSGTTTTGCRVEPGVAPGTFSIRIPVNVPASAIGAGRGTNTANLSGGGDAACTTALNQRCDATTPVTDVVPNVPRVRIYKNVRNSVTGMHVFEFALTGLSTPRETITVVNGALGIGLDSITGTAGVAVTITERALSGWPTRPMSASCTDATSGGTFGALRGSTLTIPSTRMVAGANILCTFVNDAAFAVNGRVFNDSGVGVGVPNDGLANGAEAGIGNVAMRLTDCATTSLGSAATDGRGRYTLDVPFAMAPGARLCVEERTPAGFLSTGASVGAVRLPAGSSVSSGGKSYIYTRTDPSDRIAFTWDSTPHGELNFGDVARPAFSPDGAKSGLPGSTVTHAHTFLAQTGGAVSFDIATVATPAMPGWSPKIFADTGCTGVLQGSAQVLYPPSVPTTVVAGQRVCVVVQEFIPAQAQNGNSGHSTVRANFSFTNAAPGLSASYTVHDITTVSSSALELKKEVRNVTQSGTFGLSNQAKTGETLEYRITYTNNGATPISGLIVSDTTPVYTAFVGAAAGATPAALTACAKTTPANPNPAPSVGCETVQPVGGSGTVNWKFSGALPPGATGEVLFQVRVE